MMTFQPDDPFPKGAGDTIRSKDWNDLVQEVQRVSEQIEELQQSLQNAVVRGMIIMWNGSHTDIPAGWALCNGQNGTPDLRSRFIVGAGSGGNPAYNVGDAGGPDQHTHTIDVPRMNNLTTTTAGQHNHAPPAGWQDLRVLTGAAAAGLNRADSIDRGNTSVRSTRTSTDGNHSHQITIDPPPFTSASSSGQNRPQWFALCFIMKL